MAEEPSSEAPKQETTEAEGEKPTPQSPKTESSLTPPLPDPPPLAGASPDRTVSSSSAHAKEGAAKGSALETLVIHVPVTPNSASDGDRGGGECRSFSQLLAGAMASPVGNSQATSIVAVPVDAVRLPMVAVPCFIATPSLLESSGFTGQFAMTHQAVLATVTAQAQMQLQAGYTQPPIISTVSPVSLQKSPPLVSEKVFSPEAGQPPSSDQKPQSAHIVVKTTSGDGFNWRKYGQKQVKSSENSRSYYRCTQANCSAKKKVEHSQDGCVIEIIYRGSHNHNPPRKIKCSKERGPPSSGPSGENENSSLPSGEVNELEPSPSKTEQNSGSETPEQQLHCSSDCEGDAGIKIEEDLGDEPDPKRRLAESPVTCSASLLKTVREPKIVVQVASDVGLVSDGYNWRKYGQKIVKGNPNPRSYYKCTQMGCPVRKHVERASADAKAIIITYEGKHNHDVPRQKNGSKPPATPPLRAAAAAAAATMTTDGQTPTSNSSADKQPKTVWEPDVDAEMTGDKALESAQTLLSIGFNSTPKEDGGNNSDAIQQQPLFNKTHAAVPVQNS